ncbi:sensor histidine kinase [Flavihumibacter petaseus]|uniref:histidine kinase n=1 Tax=Flavihumibacter petaseus NBRC 106054 TaxID=1220578 RepID=A0A0E9MUE0_9BACT|nr:HAMP domain-containing sensor histidine kinase [Flavihumibacter petaseus]GAO41036.1 putative two-component histidine kinase [Flavihumibacter petaseus NBRC 106054]
MKTISWSYGSILLAMLLIAGFQVYWIRDNYLREKRALESRAKSIFTETVMQLQDSAVKARIIKAGGDTAEAPGPAGFTAALRRQPPLPGDSIRQVVVFRKGGADTASGKRFLTVRENTHTTDSGGTRSVSVNTLIYTNDKGRTLLLKMDSLLSDTIPIAVIQAGFRRSLDQQEMTVGFIVFADTAVNEAEEDKLAKLLLWKKSGSYNFVLAHTFPYLLRKITLPLIFSVFLIGITLAAFLLLFHNLRKQHRLSAIKNEFISNISHELKTPIATVSVALEALRDFHARKDPLRTQEYLDISHQELQRLSLLVDKVLKLSIFEKKAIELKEEAVELAMIVEEVAGSMRLQYDKCGATLHTSFDGDTTVMGDRLHLLSVVFNLLDNALKYSGQSPEVFVRVSGTSREVILTVRDNGIGIPEVYTEKVFEKFFRVPQGNVHQAKGYGLGLSYVAAIMKQHRGSIRAESILGKGSNFILHFPAGRL